MESCPLALISTWRLLEYIVFALCWSPFANIFSFFTCDHGLLPTHSTIDYVLAFPVHPIDSTLLPLGCRVHTITGHKRLPLEYVTCNLHFLCLLTVDRLHRSRSPSQTAPIPTAGTLTQSVRNGRPMATAQPLISCVISVEPAVVTPTAPAISPHSPPLRVIGAVSRTHSVITTPSPHPPRTVHIFNHLPIARCRSANPCAIPTRFVPIFSISNK